MGVVALDRKVQIRQSLADVRERTLWLLDRVSDDFLRVRVHEFYSPIGWHFGHVGRTEEFWTVGEAMGRPLLDDALTFVLADTADNPKDNRVNIPDRAGLIDYLERTRASVLRALDEADLESKEPILADGYAWEFAVQHECQHQETIAEMLQLIQRQRPQPHVEGLPWTPGVEPSWVDLPGGTFQMGSDDPHGYDNEKPAHEVAIAPFRLASSPVTAYGWIEFVVDGGYARRDLWTDEGWAWRKREDIALPEHWLQQPDASWATHGPWGLRPLHPDEPVCGVSAHEADAYARWAGKRLPTEEEWEYVRYEPLSPLGERGVRRGMDREAGPPQVDTGEGCAFQPGIPQANHALQNWAPTPVASYPAINGLHDLAGNVWEWTSSAFLPYDGFEAYPYDGYSRDYMKGAHRVCRGGSWATSPAILRPSFRNWYVPTYRQGFLGVRLADNG